MERVAIIGALMPGRWVSCIVPGSRDAALYLSVRGIAFRSDGGASWSSLEKPALRGMKLSLGSRDRESSRAYQF
jgi:hypothetical protein